MGTVARRPLGPPSAWRGASPPAPSLTKSAMREFRKHPLQTLAFLTAAAAMARLALTPARKPHRINPDDAP